METLKELMADMKRNYSISLDCAFRDPRTSEYIERCIESFFAGDCGEYEEPQKTKVLKIKDFEEEKITGIYEKRFKLEQPLKIYAYLSPESIPAIKEREKQFKNGRKYNVIYIDYADCKDITNAAGSVAEQ